MLSLDDARFGLNGSNHLLDDVAQIIAGDPITASAKSKVKLTGTSVRCQFGG
jgi:hypothetical protein